MTDTELKTFIAAQLSIPLNQVSKLITALYAIVDFVNTINVDILPDWAGDLTFKLDGTGAGKYSKYPDVNGKVRIFETKVNDNTNHVPPSDPLTTENLYWIEISASSGSSIKEWSFGVYGTGLVIVYYNHPEDGRGLYILIEATRPFSSVNIESEINANQWARLGKPDSKFISVDTTAGTVTLNMRNLAERMFMGSDNIVANKTWALRNDINAVLIPLIRFSTDANIIHTFPPEFKMFNPLWDSTAKTWTPLDAGNYEARANKVGGFWHLTIEGPFY